MIPALDPFAFYGLPRRFFLDEGELRRKFLEKSRAFHPDHMSRNLPAEQEKALELSGLNNRAYGILKDFQQRLRCILTLEGMLSDEKEMPLPQDFLMEMMEWNEEMMELQFDPDPMKFSELEQKLMHLESLILQEARPSMEAYDLEGNADLVPVRDYLGKQRYLSRLKENLEKAHS